MAKNKKPTAASSPVGQQVKEAQVILKALGLPARQQKKLAARILLSLMGANFTDISP